MEDKSIKLGYGRALHRLIVIKLNLMLRYNISLKTIENIYILIIIRIKMEEYFEEIQKLNVRAFNLYQTLFRLVGTDQTTV